LASGRRRIKWRAAKKTDAEGSPGRSSMIRNLIPAAIIPGLLPAKFSCCGEERRSAVEVLKAAGVQAGLAGTRSIPASA
jgi:hypothetical protein